MWFLVTCAQHSQTPDSVFRCASGCINTSSYCLVWSLAAQPTLSFGGLVGKSCSSPSPVFLFIPLGWNEKACGWASRPRPLISCLSDSSQLKDWGFFSLGLQGNMTRWLWGRLARNQVWFSWRLHGPYTLMFNPGSAGFVFFLYF